VGKEPLFLTLVEVLHFHEDQIHRFGGKEGVRDLGLLESAVAQPRAFFGGHWLHENLYAMAGAYAFHICKNHPFFDGNKRTALVATLVFLEINGISVLDPKDVLADAIGRIATGQLNKEQWIDLLKTLPHE